MTIGTITLGDYVTVTPDTSPLPYASLQGPSPSMPVVSDDILSIIQAVLNVQSVASGYAALAQSVAIGAATSLAALASAVGTIDGSGDSGVTTTARFHFIRVTGTGSGSGSFQLDWGSLLPANSILFLMNAGSGALTVRRYGGSLVNTLQPGELGVYRHDQTSTDPLAVCTVYSVPHVTTYVTDDGNRNINGIYHKHTVFADAGGSYTSATYTILGGTSGNELTVVNIGFSDGIQMYHNGGNISVPIPQNGAQRLIYDGTTWRVAGFSSALHG